MKKIIPNIFVSLICFLLVLSPVSADENTIFEYTGPLDPYSTPMLLDASTIIEFDNSNMCQDWDTLTTEQQNTITSNIGLNDYNLAVLTNDDKVYLGKAIWCSSYSDGSYKLHSQSNVDNPGFYLVNADGSLTKDGEIQTLTFKSIFYSLYDVGSYWFEDYDIRTSDCAVVVNPVNPPNLVYPDISIPTINNNVQQSTQIETIRNPYGDSGYIHIIIEQYYNIYSVVQTAETDLFFDNLNDNYYKYVQNVDGRYIFPVYTHSKIIVYSPNLSVSCDPISVNAITVGDTSFAWANGYIIQRDVNKFEYEYVDFMASVDYSFYDLPFDNSDDNQNHLEYLGTYRDSFFIRDGYYSVDLVINSSGNILQFFFVSTDSTESIQITTNSYNQTIIDNNMNNNFANLDDVLQHGNALTQGSKNDLDIMDSQFNSSYDRYQSIEQGLIEDYNNNLDDIDLHTYKITNNLDLINTANFVRTQFDRLTLNNPFGLVLGFSLCVGLALLLIGKRL